MPQAATNKHEYHAARLDAVRMVRVLRCHPRLRAINILSAWLRFIRLIRCLNNVSLLNDHFLPSVDVYALHAGLAVQFPAVEGVPRITLSSYIVHLPIVHLLNCGGLAVAEVQAEGAGFGDGVPLDVGH